MPRGARDDENPSPPTGHLAGLDVLDIINEPTAAAVAYGHDQGFFDLGEAAEFAGSLGAHVVVLDRDVNALRRLQARVGSDVPTMLATRGNIEKCLAFADLFLCAVAVHGARTPVLVTRDMLKLMKPRSIIMDLSIDQGGCCETSHPTDFSSPTYVVDEVIHFCVPNLPSTASRASTRALTNSILPFVEEIADKGFEGAARNSSALCRGTYTHDGGCVQERLALAFDVEHRPIGGVS